jgi:coproporphyrinogen III oxidase-like Fe-S oxidoreductase
MNVNLDLIYGAHGETLESWERSLHEAIDLGPEHVSAYALTIEPSTPLGRKVERGSVPGPDPDLQADMFELACVSLAEAGYHHYEVSNWAKPGFECVHNLGYWERRPYVGLGAGAHAYRDDRRWWNVRPPEEYLAMVETGRLPVGGENAQPSDAYLEEVFLRLRILEGIPSSWVEPATALRSSSRSTPRGRRRARPHRARHAPAPTSSSSRCGSGVELLGRRQNRSQSLPPSGRGRIVPALRDREHLHLERAVVERNVVSWTCQGPDSGGR